MKKIREFFATIHEQITITKLDGVLIVAVSALAGIVLGMLCSPKKNMIIGSQNGNNSGNHELWDDELFEDEDWIEGKEASDKDCLSFK